MSYHSVHTAVRGIMDQAGVKVFEGASPDSDSQEGDLYIADTSLYRDIGREGIIGFMEGYVSGKWDTPCLDDLFCRLLAVNAEKIALSTPALWRPYLRHHLLPALIARFPWYNPQNRRRARQFVASHYDIGNKFYGHMLGEPMVYSCAYWRLARNLGEAQERKLELLCRKLALKSGMTVLDVGCGWGDTAAYMARNYGVRVVGITLSPAQLSLALLRHRELINAGALEFRRQDYRDVPFGEVYQAIVSVGMMEHVGPLNYEPFMGWMRHHLGPDGLFLLHTIVSRTASCLSNPWLEREIFPGGKIPSNAQLAVAAEPYFWELHSEDIGRHYDPTLMAWYRNWAAAWEGELKSVCEWRYGIAGARRFRRVWELYLRSCAGAFRCGSNLVLQKVYARHDWRGDYQYTPLPAAPAVAV